MAKRRTVHFENTQGLKLSGRLFEPELAPPRAYALFAHCFTCTANLAANRNIAEALAEAGIATLVFDFTGLGASEGAFADSSFSSNVDDLIAAATYLKESHGAPSLLIGHSLGGAAVIKAAPRINSVVAVATIGAPSEVEHVSRLVESSREEIEKDGVARVLIAGRPFCIKKQFLDDLESHSLSEEAAQLDCSLLILHAPLDETVGIENASALFVAAKHPKSFVSLDKADHLLSDPADSRYAGAAIAGWASRYLGEPVQSAAPELGESNASVARTYADGFRSELVAGGHALVADEPLSAGGSNLGPTPYDLLSSALAACTSMTLRMYANHKKIDIDHVTTTVRHSKIHAEDCEDCESEGSARVDVFERAIAISGDLSEAQRKRMIEIADRCPVHRTLEGEIKVRTKLV